ncbi:MAG: hypothetical protein J6U20_09410 [Fibrobacter sp.]|nr:hypothetical protein [Fibrobacter sp.]
MNLKKVIALTFVASALAFAQEEAPVEPQAAPAPEPVAAESAPAETVTEAAPAAEPQPESAATTATEAEQVAAPDSVQAPAQDPVAAAAPAAAPAAPDSAAPVVQEAETQVAVPPPAAPAATPVAEVAAQPAPEPVRKGPPPKTPFTVARGNAFNMVENEAAPDNVDLLLKNRLVKFAGQKFVYVEPAGEKGVVSLGNFFGAMDLSGDLGRATVGYANFGFAAELRLSLGQIAVDDDEAKKRGSYAGDDWGLTLSKVIGGLVVTAGADWVTNADEMNVTPVNGPKVEQRFRDLVGSLMISDGPMATKHFWSLGVAFVRHENENEVANRVVNEDVDSRTTVVPVFNYGTPALRSERANLYLGMNTSFPITVFDQTESVDSQRNKVVKTSQYHLGATLVPNIVAEVLMNKNVMFFGEANYEWNVIRYIWGKDITGQNYTIQQSLTDKVNASIGTRFQYDNLVACEFSLGDSFFTDTKAIFNGEGVFVKFGGFIYF